MVVDQPLAESDDRLKIYFIVDNKGEFHSSILCQAVKHRYGYGEASSIKGTEF
jgi:dipeptide/tripeptide permease